MGYLPFKAMTSCQYVPVGDEGAAAMHSLVLQNRHGPREGVWLSPSAANYPHGHYGVRGATAF